MPYMHPRHLLAAALLTACGGGSDAPKPDAPPDAYVFAEASHPSVPQLVKMTGDALATPKIVPIFFANDSATQTQIETFVHQLAGSAYWTTTTTEYGVGALTVEPTILTSDAPPTSDTALDTWLKGHFNGMNGWPAAPDPQAIYSVFLPAGTTFTTQFGTACQAFGAYHDEATTATNQPVVYALMPRCDGGSAQGTLDELTLSASHEWIEAATDPRVETAPAYGNMDDDHYVWAYVPGAEAGDLCEYVDAANHYKVGDFTVQRTWSNAAAMAGHDPCVPAPDPATTPYLGIAPVLDASVNLPNIYTNAAQMTKGVQIAQGSGKVIEVDLFSDSQAGTWNVEAIDIASAFNGGTAELSLQLDKKMGTNGDKLQMTVTHIKDGTQMPGSVFLLESKDSNGSVAQWWGFVAN